MLLGIDVWEHYDEINGIASSNIHDVVIPAIAGIVTVIIYAIIVSRKHRRLTPEDRLETADTIDEMPIDTFVDITDEQYMQANDIGCYILYNIDKEKYYIGRSNLCADAVNRQIIGKGSPDIFYEKKSGDDFTVQFYFVSGKLYTDVDKLYEDIVEVYGENSEVVGL